MTRSAPSHQASRLTQFLWVISAALLLLGAFQLGQQGSIGADAWRAGSCHVGMTLLLIPLIRYAPRRRSAMVLVLLSLLARCAIFPMAPSDDVHRYVWEGRAWQEGFNPYAHSPDDTKLAHLRTDTWHELNHPHMTAIYPPGALLFFSQITKWSSHPVCIKAIMTLADLGVLVLILACLQRSGRKLSWALLYGLHPITLLSFAGEGHLDVLLLLGLVGAVYFDLSKRPGWAFAALALSVHAKIVSILLLPFLLRRATWRHVWAFALPLVLLFIPFLSKEGFFSSLISFSSDMHYNGSLHHWLGNTFDAYSYASRLCGCGLVVWLMGVRVWTPRLLEAAPYVMGALLFLSPNVHFWYVSWFLPFLCFYPLRPLLLFSITIALSYATQGHLVHHGEWREFEQILQLEYLPVYLLLAYMSLRPRRLCRLADARPGVPLTHATIIVPTKNEGSQLEAFLTSAMNQQGARPDVLVCDCGSTDDTVRIAKRMGATVLHAQQGRGHQIAAGVRHATGDFILVAHADMTLAPDVLVRIQDILDRSGQRGGCVGCRFESHHPFLWVIDQLNRIRASIFGVSFGDQGQFIRRDALADIGGFPDVPIMEDLEFSLRLRELERPLYVGGGIRVSARRWKRSAKLAHTFLVLKLVAQYQLRRLVQGRELDLEDLYTSYYGTLRKPLTSSNQPPEQEPATSPTSHHNKSN